MGNKYIKYYLIIMFSSLILLPITLLIHMLLLQSSMLGGSIFLVMLTSLSYSIFLVPHNIFHMIKLDKLEIKATTDTLKIYLVVVMVGTLIVMILLDNINNIR